jgi:FtsP/CotA-like multicopper oxidase with cupredoxin domain
MTTDLATSPSRPDRSPARRQRRLLRRLVLGTLALGLIAVLGLAGLVAWFWSQADMSNVGQLGFANQLKIPPLLQPRIDGAGRKIFDLRLQQGTSELLAAKPTQTWGANGTYLGPTIRATGGDQVAMRVRNDLPEPTTIHWHGMHLPAAADGGPHQTIAPGQTWSPSWRIDQPAATLWYHPHPHGATEDHVYRGVAGLFLLDDPQASTLPLPDRYGVDDIPVILQDKRFDRNGDLDFGQSPFSPIGRLGDQLLVNGTHDPHLNITSQRVRLRLLNASTARVYNVGFADDRSFELIGTDGGLLERPQPTSRVPLSPGERAEIVTEFRPGERVVLRSFPPDLGLDGFQGRFAGADDTFDLLQVRAGPRLTPSPPVPDRLARHQQHNEADVIRTRRLELNGSSRINDLRMDLGRIDQTVTVDTTEQWDVTNRSGNPHNFHVHGVQFNVASYLGGPPPPHLAGWKDTVFIPPGGTVRLLVQFPGYSDPALPYMFHCHLLEHEDNGMMGQFLVVQPGQPPTSPSQQHHHDRRQNPTSRELQPESDRRAGA